MSRAILTAALTVNVDPGHIQEACNSVVNDYDCNGHIITLQLRETEYTDQVELSTQPLGAHVFTIRGNPSNPSACMWTPHVGGAILRVTDFGAVVADGIEFGFYVNGGNACVAAYQFGIVDVQNCLFGSCIGGVHMTASYHGAINVTGPYTIDGNAANHVGCSSLGKINLGSHAVSMPHALTFSDAFVRTASGGYVGVGGSPYSGAGAGTGSNCSRYAVTGNSVLELNGVTLPGNSSGTVSTGAQVV